MLLRSVSSKFDAITSSIEQFQVFDSLTLDEVIGSLKINEDKLKDRSTKTEEKALLTRAFGKSEKKEDDNSRGRGTSCSRGRGRSNHHNENSDEEDEKPRDKSKVIFYKCKKLGHYVNKCY
ncbi:unnamed protein product [Spirodela intermedia]|uniref:CCHC-type domain-containing protein n=1 Tax=Spirodela intermedia TaxID=51605 RepID=A0ABN7E8Y2_SPIIN|nr:unnamed protein product [Spirodela intermedia]